MTNLKDKLSASLRQAKEGGQAPAKPVAKAIKKTPPKALAVNDPVTEPKSQQRPKPTPKAIPITSSGFGFPERIWPD